MTTKKQMVEVFKTVGLPPYTYVKPSMYSEVKVDIQQPGKHLLIEGPSGAGKTCIVYKVFEEFGWREGNEYILVSCREEGTNKSIDRFFENASGTGGRGYPVIVIDDFHFLSPDRRAEIGSLLKRLSDRAFEAANPPKAILIGIPMSGQSLLAGAYDLGQRLGVYKILRASDNDIDRLITEGEQALNVLFEDRGILLGESAGNFWLAQYICSKVCSTQEVVETQDEPRILSFDLLGIRERLMTELSQRYMPLAKSFAKGKKWRPGGNKPYMEVLLALARIPDSVVSFDKILNMVPDRRKPGIRAIRTRIHEVIYDPTKNVDLRKQVAFEADSGFSVEDPLFRYFLSYLDPDDLYRELGVETQNVETARLYSYDIGFSFAGETRRLVEAVNTQLKAEDIITFYDFDQQAFLLALDMEKTLARIYSESCRYYLVFLDAHYTEKVWAKYEKDIMTGSGRRGHIIPVVLDEAGAKGVVGLSTTVGRIDLREQWAEIQKTGNISPEVVSAIRNRCVLLLIEKIDNPSAVV